MRKAKTKEQTRVLEKPTKRKAIKKKVVLTEDDVFENGNTSTALSVQVNNKITGLKSIVDWNAEKPLTLMQEMFCRYYVIVEKTRSNASRSYEAAYGYDIDGSPSDDAVYEYIPSGVEGAPPEKKCIRRSTQDIVNGICRTEGNRNLSKPNIQRRITQLLNEIISKDLVDAELGKVILQDKDLSAKVQSIREYNKLNGRIRDQVDHTHKMVGVIKHLYGNADSTEKKIHGEQ